MTNNLSNEWPALDAIPVWPDVEDLLCTYFERFGHTCTWWPPEKDESGAPVFESLLPILMIQRTGGAKNGNLDNAIVQVSSVGTDRAMSWAAIGQVRRAVEAAEHGAVVDGVVFTEMFEVVGPQQVPGLNPDHREVPLTIQVVVQRPR